jgi:hypothetical protein
MDLAPHVIQQQLNSKMRQVVSLHLQRFVFMTFAMEQAIAETVGGGMHPFRCAFVSQLP